MKYDVSELNTKRIRALVKRTGINSTQIVNIAIERLFEINSCHEGHGKVIMIEKDGTEKKVKRLI